MKDVENVVKNSRKLGKLPEKPRKDRGQLRHITFYGKSMADRSDRLSFFIELGHVNFDLAKRYCTSPYLSDFFTPRP